MTMIDKYTPLPGFEQAWHYQRFHLETEIWSLGTRQTNHSWAGLGGQIKPTTVSFCSPSLISHILNEVIKAASAVICKLAALKSQNKILQTYHRGVEVWGFWGFLWHRGLKKWRFQRYAIHDTIDVTCYMAKLMMTGWYYRMCYKHPSPPPMPRHLMLTPPWLQGNWRWPILLQLRKTLFRSRILWWKNCFGECSTV